MSTPRGVLLLSPYAQLYDQRSVALDIVAGKVVEQAPTLAYQEQESAAGVVILPMRLQVLGELLDALGKDRNLNFRRPRVRVVEPVLRDQRSLDFVFDCQTEVELYPVSTPAPRGPVLRPGGALGEAPPAGT